MFCSQTLSSIAAAFQPLSQRQLAVHSATCQWRRSAHATQALLSTLLFSFADSCLKGAMVERSEALQGTCAEGNRRQGRQGLLAMRPSVAYQCGLMCSSCSLPPLGQMAVSTTRYPSTPAFWPACARHWLQVTSSRRPRAPVAASTTGCCTTPYGGFVIGRGVWFACARPVGARVT